MRPLAALACLALLQGCATLRPAARCDCPAVDPTWNATLRMAGELAEAGRFAAVDSLLASYGEQRQGTVHGREVVFWRALYQLDPRNPAPRPEAAATLLDWYLLSDSVHWYRSEARLLRQLASLHSPGLPPTPPPQPVAGPPVVRPSENADKDAEIQQLRQRVAQLNEELERIKRRLSAP